MKPSRKVLLRLSFLVLLVAVCLFLWVSREHHLPSEQSAREQFDTHKSDYVRFVALIRQDPGTKSIGNDGNSSAAPANTRLAPEYRDLIRRIGAQFVDVREDGSVEFALRGSGCAICSDSYMGVRYFPEDHNTRARLAWAPKLVNSLESKSLPQERGSVADGLYVVQLEPEWFLYRLQIN